MRSRLPREAAPTPWRPPSRPWAPCPPPRPTRRMIPHPSPPHATHPLPPLRHWRTLASPSTSPAASTNGPWRPERQTLAHQPWPSCAPASTSLPPPWSCRPQPSTLSKMRTHRGYSAAAPTGFGALAVGTTPAFPGPPFRPPPPSSSAPSAAEAAGRKAAVTWYSGQRPGGLAVGLRRVRTTPLERRPQCRHPVSLPCLPLPGARRLTTSTCTPRAVPPRHPDSARPNAPAKTPAIACGS
mmetsp:Transcript_45152/g.127457  ORF Transcript_45152/g.127457 Transcript_45152/m.127457 type:complete len:240 (+) Transcript_45152:315-1034(+)